MFKNTPKVYEVVDFVLAQAKPTTRLQSIHQASVEIIKCVEAAGKQPLHLNSIKKKVTAHVNDYTAKVIKSGSKRSKIIAWRGQNSNIFEAEGINGQHKNDAELAPMIVETPPTCEKDLKSKDFCLLRDGAIIVKKVGTDGSCQTDDQTFPRLETKQNSKEFSNEIKSALCSISSKVCLTIGETRAVFIEIANTIFHQNYDDSDVPSISTLRDWKYLLALERERQIAIKVANKDGQDVICAQFDFTKRAKVNGEFPSMILNVNNKDQFNLRPLPLGVENKSTIAGMIHENINRLAVLSQTTPRKIFENVDAIMSDSASKNLNVGEVIAKEMETDHVPIHLLCGAHPAEAMNGEIFKSLGKLEESLCLKEKFVSRVPFLESFLRGTSCTMAAVEAICSYVSNTGKPSSDHESFDNILAKKGKCSRIVKLDHKRFGHHGMMCRQILVNIAEIQQLCAATTATNRLKIAVSAYIECEFVLVAIKCIAIFTFSIILPYMNMVSKSNQLEFSKNIQKVYEGLQLKQLDVLSDYVKPFEKHLFKIESSLEQQILDLFCGRCADVIMRQKGREYGFSSQTRTTDITTIPEGTLKLLPADNMTCERDFSQFDRLAAKSAKTANRNYNATGIKNDMVLYKSSDLLFVSQETKILSPQMKEMEKKFSMQQNELVQEKLKKKIMDSEKHIETGNLFLLKCKEWGGPLTTLDELQKLVDDNKNDKTLKKKLRAEIQLKKYLSPKDTLLRPQLYKVNAISSDLMITNLKKILGHYKVNPDEAIFPGEDEILEAIQDFLIKIE